ncbi:MAG: SDR family NAD(P)-dependent oxidoreductase [Alphaproteobacteria bacterium]|nr:MAG: SDR family NAD(P)-dependent oxidoreductase [Alphaproteobacteria bacterium]
MTTELDGQIALVTGASRGIGYALARELASRGAHIIAVARTIGGLEELDDEIQSSGGSTTLVPTDLREGDAIDQIGGAIAERWGHLDILVGNAAMLGILGPVAHLDPDVWNDIYALNVTANYRLIRTCDALLQAAPSARALFMTSTVGAEPRAYWGAYASSKAALESLVLSYALEVDQSNMKVNLLNPGGTRTSMRAAAMPGEDPTTLPSTKDIAQQVVKMLLPNWETNGQRLHITDLA